MLGALQDFLAGWSGLRQFKSVPRAERRVVIYSEGGGYWTYFGSIYTAFRAISDEPVLYVTSKADDPLLQNPLSGMRSFYVGMDSARTIFFASLDVDLLLMTMPDLQTFHIKRSLNPVHYVYTHHSLVSTHMTYLPGAFDHFDTVFCAGPHHCAEIRAREALCNLPAKELIPHGYGRLDDILATESAGPLERSPQDPPHVLLAPSWGERGFLEEYGATAVQSLLSSNLRVTVRPHPRTLQFHAPHIMQMAERHCNNPSFSLDTDFNSHASLQSADLMISDWSGAAIEYALGFERPVIFIDTPPKMRNPDYAALNLSPLEIFIREKIGIIHPLEKLDDLGASACEVIAHAGQWQSLIRTERARWVYNCGQSGHAAATYLRDWLLQHPPKHH
ncbi:MAG: CDP-glycerol glycerophosphotransferase family protein [Candidatus Sericytochromatia bacterium]|nr:CDP-glycerol glycerophosphotransferase family protein [Candidatus Sericytochromatia bacterium]